MLQQLQILILLLHLLLWGPQHLKHGYVFCCYKLCAQKKNSQRTEAKTGSLTSAFQLQLSHEKKERVGWEREREKKKGSWEGGRKMVPCEETSVHSSVDTRNSGTSFHLGILCNLRNPRVWDNSKLHPSFLSTPTHHHDYYCPRPQLRPTPLISLLLLLFLLLLLLLLLLTLSLFSLPSLSYTSGAWLGTSLSSTDFLQQS